jgi:uncharacterized protein YqjF (DUF2071 family)
MVGREPENRVRFPMVRQDWCAVTFVHWSFAPAVVQSLLPDDLTVDTADGVAWVTLTPFSVERLRPPVGPRVPGVARFAETNLRTYVTAPDGSDGLHFFDIEASNAIVSRTIRAVFGLPYNVAKMGVSTADDKRSGHRRYIGNRSTGAGDVGYDIRVESGARLTGADSDAALDEWLVGRWRAFGTVRSRRIAIEVEHRPWELHAAVLLRCEEDLLAVTGLPAPGAPALVRCSPGVAVALAFPRRVRSGA